MIICIISLFYSFTHCIKMNRTSEAYLVPILEWRHLLSWLTLKPAGWSWFSIDRTFYLLDVPSVGAVLERIRWVHKIAPSCRVSRKIKYKVRFSAGALPRRNVSACQSLHVIDQARPQNSRQGVTINPGSHYSNELFDSPSLKVV